MKTHKTNLLHLLHENIEITSSHYQAKCHLCHRCYHNRVTPMTKVTPMTSNTDDQTTTFTIHASCTGLNNEKYVRIFELTSMPYNSIETVLLFLHVPETYRVNTNDT